MLDRIVIITSSQCKFSIKYVEILNSKLNLKLIIKVLKCIHNIKIICLRYADEVSVDYEVLVQRNGRLMPAKVINISNFKMQGNICFHESLHFLVLMVVIIIIIVGGFSDISGLLSAMLHWVFYQTPGIHMVMYCFTLTL